MGPPHIEHHQSISETLSCHSQMESVSIKWVSQPRHFVVFEKKCRAPLSTWSVVWMTPPTDTTRPHVSADFFQKKLPSSGSFHEGWIVDHIPIAFHISAIYLPVLFPFSQSCLDSDAHRKVHHNTYSIQVYRQLTMSTLRMSGLAIQDHPQTPSGDTPEASR